MLPRREECPQVYEVAQEFRARCLDSDGSLLWNRPDVWTVDNLKLLQNRLLSEPTSASLDFWVKLREELAGVPAECYMILSDALVVYSLPSLSMNKDTKMSFLRRAREIGGTEPPALDTRISQAFDQGMVYTTAPYHRKYPQVWLLVRFALRLKEGTTRLQLADAWDAAGFLDECLYSFDARDRGYDMRHILLHMLFPDTFESVMSTAHKRQIVEAVLPHSEIEAPEHGSSDAQDLVALDRLLLRVRQQLRAEMPGPDIDFYSPRFAGRWRGKKPPTETKDTFAEPFSTVFASREEAIWAFKLMNRCISGLGLGIARDLKLVLTFARGGKAIHLIFCNWLIVGFNAPNYEPQRLEALLLESTAASLGRSEASYSFKQADSEPKLKGYTLSIEEALGLGQPLLAGIEEALTHVVDRFSSYKKSPFTRFHVSDLQRAALDESYRDTVLDEGLVETDGVEQPAPGYWVFHADPAIYRVVDALRDENLKTWSVKTHQEQVKRGDKAIIWVTGADSGCYALATINTDPYLGHDDEAESSYYQSQLDALEETPRCELSFDVILVDRPVLKKQVLENPLLKDLRVGLQGSIFPATSEQFNEILRIASSTPPPVVEPCPASTNPQYPLSQMSAETGFSEEELAGWVRAIERKGQVIFYGPPGTGKTFVAERLAKHIIAGGNGFAELVQFHPAYAYEDFIQGIRVRTSDDGRLSYPMEPGRFLQFCSKASLRSDRSVLVVDEINRANLSRVFGELMYLLEYRDRQVPLAGDGRHFGIPAGVRIIGTMNTADRSIALVDHALRRRFAFIPLYPDSEILRKYHANTGFPVDNLVKVVSRLNRQIDDRHFEVGISFFMQEHLAEELGDIWRMEIEPYLEEYFSDQPSIVQEFRWTKVKDEILA